MDPVSNNSIIHKCSICLGQVDMPENATVESIKKDNIALEGPQALPDNMEAVATRCNHVFHNSCLKNWVDRFKEKTRAPSCPECRTELAPAALEIRRPNFQYVQQQRPAAIMDESHRDFQPVRLADIIDEVDIPFNAHTEINFPNLNDQDPAAARRQRRFRRLLNRATLDEMLAVVRMTMELHFALERAGVPPASSGLGPLPFYDQEHTRGSDIIRM